MIRSIRTAALAVLLTVAMAAPANATEPPSTWAGQQTVDCATGAITSIVMQSDGSAHVTGWVKPCVPLTTTGPWWGVLDFSTKYSYGKYPKAPYLTGDVSTPVDLVFVPGTTFVAECLAASTTMNLACGAWQNGTFVPIPTSDPRVHKPRAPGAYDPDRATCV